MTKKDSTLIVMVMDRSGSMAPLTDATIRGFNEFVEGQKKQPGEARMVLCQFDHEYQVDCWNTLLHDVRLNYSPRGWTALLDAVGRTVDNVGSWLASKAEHERPAKVIFVIVTDGLENHSVKFTRQQVMERITHQREKYGWEFIFMGANMDAVAEAGALGIPAGYAANYAATQQGTQSSYGSASGVASRIRSAVPNAGFTAGEREKMKDTP